MNSFPNAVYQKRVGLLISWRNRYEKSIYPKKVIENLIYETLTTEEMWDEIQSYFNQFDLQGNRKAYSEFTDAHRFVFNRRRQVQLNKIHSIIEEEYIHRDRICNLNIVATRNIVELAQNYDNNSVEELEYTYHYYCLAHECIYAWGACGLLGLSQKQAYEEVADLAFDGIIFSALEIVEQAFGQNSGFWLNRLYKPLQAIW